MGNNIKESRNLKMFLLTNLTRQVSDNSEH